MDTQPLKLQVDSKQAQADLAALAKALDVAGSSVEKMQGKFASGMSGADAALDKSVKSMAKFAEVAGLLSKIKFSGDGTKQVTEFANAMAQVAKAKEIERSKLDGYRKFIEFGAQVSRLKMTPGSFAGINQLATALDTVARARAIPAAKLTSWVNYIEVAARASKLSISPNAASGLSRMATALDSIAKVRSLSDNKVKALKDVLDVLSKVKPIDGAKRIAADLDAIASSAARAGAALNAMPARIKSLGPATVASAKGASDLNKHLAEAPSHAAKAQRGFLTVGNSLDGLSARFKLSYQAGTLFSAMFSAFTVGQFVKGIYDTTIQSQKLDKAMLFLTGSFKEAHKASSEYFEIANKLGMRALENADSYSRFAISSKAIGATQQDVNKIFEATGLALTSVGASSQQWEYALYGLSQAMAKGKISSEEFNRQIGEQIPGNVAAGVRALTALTGKASTANDLFAAMKAGSLQSLPFLKAWAGEIQKMFSPLLPIAEKRPDFQLTRVMNAYDLFKQSAGNGGFVSELASQFKRLADSFLVTDASGTHLSERGEKLAKTIGQNLGQMVKALGNGLNWLANNIDTVVMALKGIAALTVGRTLLDWSKSAAEFADKQMAIVTANTKRVASERAVAAATKESTVATAVSGEVGTAKTAMMGGPTLLASKGQHSYATLRKQGFSHEDASFYGTMGTRPNAKFTAQSGELFGNPGQSTVRTFGRRIAATETAVASTTTGAAAAAAMRTQMQTQATGLSMVSRGAVQAFAGLRGALNMLPGVAMAAGIALAVFGDKITGVKTAAGNNVTVNDIAGGAASSVGSEIGKWMNDTAVGIGALFGVSKENAGGKSLGEWLAWIAAGFITLGKGLFSLADSLGKVLGTILGDIMGDIVTLARQAERLIHLDWRGAQQIGSDWKKNKDAMALRTVAQIGENTKNAFDIRGEYDRIMAGAKQSADARSAGEITNPQDAAGKMAIEAALKTQAAADAQMRAAANLESAARSFKGDVAPDFDKVRASLEALVTGKITPGSPAGVAAPAATAAQASIKQTLDIAAQRDLGKSVYDAAASLKGLNEHNKGDAKSLSNLFKGAGITLDPEKQAWCAAFVNAVLAGQGIQGNGSTVASSFKNFGTATTAPQRGDVVVLKPQGSGSGHVGFYDGHNSDGSVRVLGGNQGDGEVKVSRFAANQVVGFRRLPGVTNTNVGEPSGATDESAFERTAERRQNDYKSLMSVLGEGDPAQAARAKAMAALEKMDDFIQRELKLRDEAKSSKTPFDTYVDDSTLAKYDTWVKRQQKDIREADNPFLKDLRVSSEQQQVLDLRLRGLSDEADFQEKLNGLVEQGYEAKLLDTQANRDAMKVAAEGLRTRQIELDLIKAKNDATVASIARTGSARDAAMAQRVSSAGLEGEDYATTLARLKASGGLGKIAQIVDTGEQSRVADVMKGYADSLAEMQATRGMSASQRNVREDFKAYLKDITGVQSDSLAAIAAGASRAQLAMAESYAKLKFEFENPPGFQRWADGLEPLAKRLEDIKAQFAEDLSSNITDALMGEDVDWKAMLHKTFKAQLKAQVDEGLKGVMGWFGVGSQKGATPEAQALMGAASVQGQAAYGLGAAATNLNTAAQALAGAAQSVGAGAGGVMGVPVPVGAGSVSMGGVPVGGGSVGGLTGSATSGGGLGLGGSYVAPTQGPSLGSIFSAPLAAMGMTRQKGGILNAIASQFGVSGFGRQLTDVGGISAGGGNTGVTNGIGMITGPARASEAGSAMSIGSAQISTSNMTATASTVTLNASSVSGMGGGMGGAPMGGIGTLAAPGMGGTQASAGIGGLMNGLGGGMSGLTSMLGGGGITAPAVNPVSVMDNILTPLTVDSTGGPGFMAAGSMLQNLNITPPGGGGLFGGLSGMFSGMGGMMQGAMGFLGPLLGGLLTKPGSAKQKTEKPMKAISGVLGEYRPVSVTGTQVGAHANPISELINLGLSLFTGGMTSGAGLTNGGGMLGKMLGMGSMGNMTTGLFGGMGMGGLGQGLSGFGSMFQGMGGMNLFGAFKEGGYASSPVSMASAHPSAWANAPHYSEGTPNTSGGMPAILHPNEAVIPLSRGRSIPIEMPEGAVGGSNYSVTSNITVIAPNPDSFRQSQGSIRRQQNRDLRRAAVRNLNAA